MKLKVRVTDNHIAKGMKNFTDGTKCPYGLAINEALKKAGLKLKGYINWGGEICIGGNVYYPQELHSMPDYCGTDEYTAAHIEWIATKRNFTIQI